MKTTVYVEDDLLREARVEAAQQGRSLSDVVEDALRTRGDSAPQRRARPAWAEVFASAEVTGAGSEDVLRAELGGVR